MGGWGKEDKKEIAPLSILTGPRVRARDKTCVASWSESPGASQQGARHPTSRNAQKVPKSHDA